MIDLLTKQELKKLSGQKLAADIILWLAENDWVFEVGADGWPRVDRRYYDKRMTGEINHKPTEPNYDAVA